MIGKFGYVFEWDDAKNAENFRKHGITFEEASTIWRGDTLSRADDRRSYGEPRELTLGLVRGVAVLAVVHTDRDGTIRIISARKATPIERRIYGRHLRRTFG